MEQKQLIRQKECDTAEPWAICEKLLEVGWERKRLWSGDYYFQSHDYMKIGITRKATTDLFNSIGEVFNKQLEEMIDYYDIKILLIEGSWSMINPNTGNRTIVANRGLAYQTWDLVWNYLRRWQDKGFSLELTTSMGHTVDRLNKLYALYQKPYSLSAKSRKWSDDRVLAFPSGCRGKTAQQILDSGKSLVDIGMMSIEELKGYEKIGDKKARLIVEHFGRRSNNG